MLEKTGKVKPYCASMAALFALMLFLILSAAGCKSPAVVPAPPLEIPSVLTFPQSVGVNLAPIETNASPLSLLKLLEGPPGQFSDIITIGPIEARTVNDDILDIVLIPFNEFEIPVSPTVTTFQGVSQVQDTIPQEVKFDFAPFDFDGDGTPEACTGCTCPVGCSTNACPSGAPLADLKPVCFRIWIKRDPTLPFERVMAGFFDIMPVRDDPNTPEDETNPGKGRFRAGSIVNGTIDGQTETESFLTGVIYDHRDPNFPANQSTEAFVINEATESGIQVLSNNIHLQVSQVERLDPSGKHYLEKNVKSTDQELGATELGTVNNFLQKYIGRFRDDADFWSGSLFELNQGVERNVTPTCARISTGSFVDRDICLDLAIDTLEETFLDLSAESDVAFPADFPLNPTF